MESQYDREEAGWQEAQRLAQELETYLGPLLVWLDALLDKRLVRTFVEGIAAIIRFRNRAQGLCLSELGSYLHEGKSAPAGTKRLGNLLRAFGWDKKLIERYLWMKADERIEELEKSGEEALNVWDESVIEKTESEKTEGLCAVKSSKAVRLRKQRKGVWNPPTGKPITVLGMEWIGMLLLGMHGVPVVATMRWWTSKEVWDVQKRCWRKMSVVALPVRHAKYAGPLWLVVGRMKKEPWYLITNEPIETVEDMWKVIFAYARRWQIEMMFRYGKSELAMEGRTPLSGDRAQPRFLFLESQKSKIGRRGIASYTLGQAWNRKRGSQFLQPIFFDFGKKIRRDFVGENLPQTPSMIG